MTIPPTIDQKTIKRKNKLLRELRAINERIRARDEAMARYMHRKQFQTEKDI